MYPTVPTMTPGVVPVIVGSCEPSPLPDIVEVSFARPKSRILTSPSFVTITFSGFKSRWTIPASCALARPSAICAAIGSSFFDRQRAAGEKLPQRRALHPLHRDVGDPALRPDVVDRDDVGVIERRGRPRLLLETLQPLRVRRQLRRQHLDRDLAREPRVPRPVDLPHSRPRPGGPAPRRGRAGYPRRSSATLDMVATSSYHPVDEGRRAGWNQEPEEQPERLHPARAQGGAGPDHGPRRGGRRTGQTTNRRRSRFSSTSRRVGCHWKAQAGVGQEEEAARIAHQAACGDSTKAPRRGSR